jgi:hypothetical protein
MEPPTPPRLSRPLPRPFMEAITTNESSEFHLVETSQLSDAMPNTPAKIVLSQFLHGESSDIDKAERSDKTCPEVLPDPLGGEEVSQGNPALAIRTKVTLDIEPFPNDILRIINTAYSFKVTEKDSDLVVPITSLYQCVWNGAPTYLEEKSDIWCGAEYGNTTWLTFKRLGTFPTPVNESFQESSVETLTGSQSFCSPGKSTTIARYITSLVDGGDNHISLLTAAYCVLFDRLWW